MFNFKLKLMAWSLFSFGIAFGRRTEIKITKDQAKKIGFKIWENESNKSKEKLAWWNAGEDFASVGIGHFIWCPKKKCGFNGGFEELRDFLKSNRVVLPSKFQGKCPWKDRKTFLEEYKSHDVQRLRQILLDTIDLQILYMVKKIQRVPFLLNRLPAYRRKHAKEQFVRVLTAGFRGIYALIDYLNFKGIGSALEKYKGKGWGLIQVLENMRGAKEAPDALKEFARSAQFVLERRVKNAPRDESKWLPGWKKRIQTYASLN